MNRPGIASIDSAAPGEVRKAGDRYAVFGNPLGQSLSPAMQGAAFAALGIVARYDACEIGDAAGAVERFRALGLCGASVTLPFKEAIMPLLDEVDPDAQRIGAVNTIVRRGDRLVGYNTDGLGLVRDLEEWMGGLAGKRFILLGAGGAARAALYTLSRAGGILTVSSRTPERAAALAREFGCEAVPLAEIGDPGADCLINSTPVGMYPEAGRTPLNGPHPARFSRVMDMVYNPVMTRLLREAAGAGCTVRTGVGMFVHQGAEQFRLWTGMEPPRETMRRVVMERLGDHG